MVQLELCFGFYFMAPLDFDTDLFLEATSPLSKEKRFTHTSH